jgi:DNA repair ATPase RecN
MATTRLLDETESTLYSKRKIARLESELSVIQEQLTLTQSQLDQTTKELSHALSVCNNLSDELEDSMNKMEQINELSSKKRSFSEIA